MAGSLKVTELSKLKNKEKIDVIIKIISHNAKRSAELDLFISALAVDYLNFKQLIMQDMGYSEETYSMAVEDWTPGNIKKRDEMMQHFQEVVEEKIEAGSKAHENDKDGD